MMTGTKEEFINLIEDIATDLYEDAPDSGFWDGVDAFRTQLLERLGVK